MHDGGFSGGGGSCLGCHSIVGDIGVIEMPPEGEGIEKEIGESLLDANKNLKVAANTMGARVVGSIVTGLIAQKPKRELPRRTRRRARKLAPRLAG